MSFNPFKNWMTPVLFSFLSLLIFTLSVFIDNDVLNLFSGLLLLISSLLIVISLFILLFRKEWKKFFYTLLIIIAIIVDIGLLFS